MQNIIKRDGRVERFEVEKITRSIFRAAEAVGGKDRELSGILASQVQQMLEQKFKTRVPNVEEVQDLVEKVLIENGHAKTAKEYILRRYQKDQEEKRKALILGDGKSDDNLLFSAEALKILERRYLLKDAEGNTVETPRQMLRRVAQDIAQADEAYGASAKQIQETADAFFRLMAELRFLPNSPTLVNAGTKTQQLSSCFVLPIGDTMKSIFGTLRDAAVIHQQGSGTGFSFSRLRPKGDPVGKHQSVAAGPVSFLRVYDSALETIKQGGIRPGANMAVLRVDHPDIIRFIESKRDKKSLKSFNISVAVTDNFMRAVTEDREYYLTNPRTGKYFGRLRARDVFAMITQNAWKTGDPGLLFIDEINRKHPAKHFGDIETTNQCGEAPLLPHEGCVLGSLNLNAFVTELKVNDLVRREIDWKLLGESIAATVHFLDNVIDRNDYPQPEIEAMTKKTRKFGLGIMGFADVLARIGIKYNSEEGLAFGRQIMSFIENSAYETSERLAKQRGACPAWKDSDHYKAGRKMRNMTCISVAPTGTISILANASPGCEPLYAVAYHKTVLGDTSFIHLNPHFEQMAKEREFYTPELIRKIAKSGSIQECKEIPKEIRDVFVTAQDIGPEWHINMQATLQEYVDNSISKTINFPRTAAIKDVENAYMLAWKSKCKGITIYRDGSYEEQVLTIGNGGEA